MFDLSIGEFCIDQTINEPDLYKEILIFKYEHAKH